MFAFLKAFFRIWQIYLHFEPAGRYINLYGTVWNEDHCHYLYIK